MLRFPERPLRWLVPVPLVIACAEAPPPADTAPTPATPDADAGISLGEVRACDAPAAEPSWTDRAETWGVKGPGEGVDHNDGGGAVLDDVDADGDLDLVLFFARRQGALYRWGGTGYTSETLDSTAWSATLLDLDGDGARDLLGAGAAWGWLAARDGTWVPDEPDWATALPEGMTVKEFAPGDADGDGDIDLLAVTIAMGVGPFADVDPTLQTDFLLLDEGGHYVQGPALDPGSAARAGFAAAWLDADEDGRLDVYVSNDHGETYGPNVLWLNRGDGFVDAGHECFCDFMGQAMGVTAADVDRDGHTDLFVSATSRNLLLRGQGDGTFVDVTAVAGVNTLTELYHMGWGAAVADLDNDGLPDILAANGDSWSLEETDPPYVFDSWTDVLVQREDGTFEDQREAWGFPTGGSFRAMLPWDVNGDGVLDVLVTEVAEAPHWMVSDGCTTNNWLAVDAPEGSTVEVWAGGVRWVARATSDVGYAASAPPRVHVGLGAAERVDELTVHRPDGSSVTAHDFDARRVVTVK